jgi:capsule polysaccharide export protein KpsE/RkpR
LILLRRYHVRMNDNKPPQVTDLKEAQLLIDQLWLMINSLTKKVHSLEKQIKDQKGKLSNNSKSTRVYAQLVFTL